MSATGIVGLVAHPLTGAMKSVRKLGVDARAAEQRIYRLRIQQGKNSTSTATVSLGEPEKVISAFKEATRPENEKRRRELMEERVEAAISRGGAGTVTSNTSNENNKAKAVDAPPEDGPSAPALQSTSMNLPVELTEEQEAYFAWQLEEAKTASLAIAQTRATDPLNETRAMARPNSKTQSKPDVKPPALYTRTSRSG